MRAGTAIFLLAGGLAPAFPAAVENPAAAEYDAALDEYIALADALLPILSSARDRASADAAAPGLEAEIARLYRVREKLKKLPEPGNAESKELERKYAMRMRTQWGRVFDEIYRLQAAECLGSESFRKAFTTLCLILR